MGIKDLNTYLRKEEIDCFFTLPLSSFSEQRFAIDGLNWVFTYLSNSYRKIYERSKDPLDITDQEELFIELLKEFLNFNNKLMNHKITPVWIWDGISKDNKTATKIERRAKRQELIEKRDNLRNQLLKQSFLERDTNLLTEYKKLVLNTATIAYEKIDKLKKLNKDMGLPTIIAEDEAENLASSLAMRRKISAVWSADTDTYPLGAPLVVKGFENINGKLCIRGINTLKMLEHLNMTHCEFRDFCILLGTDFNSRIPGIGPSKSKFLIDKFKILENIEDNTKHNLYSMHYKDVRMQLTPYDTDYTCKDFQVNKNINLDDLIKIIDCREMINLYNNIKDLPVSKPVPKN